MRDTNSLETDGYTFVDHSMATANLKKSEDFMTNTTTAKLHT